MFLWGFCTIYFALSSSQTQIYPLSLPIPLCALFLFYLFSLPEPLKSKLATHILPWLCDHPLAGGRPTRATPLEKTESLSPSIQFVIRIMINLKLHFMLGILCSWSWPFENGSPTVIFFKVPFFLWISVEPYLSIDSPCLCQPIWRFTLFYCINCCSFIESESAKWAGTFM